MPDMITMFSNSGFQLSARLSNIRRIVIVTRYFIYYIALRCMRTNVLLYFYIFTHFIGTVKRYPDVVFIKSSKFLRVTRNTRIWNRKPKSSFIHTDFVSQIIMYFISIFN